MSEPLFLDFETRSRADLRKVGAYRYAEDPSTEATMASWVVGRGEVRQWQPGGDAEWLAMVRDPRGPTIVAHNAEFEREILRHVFRVVVPPERFRCSAALAARHSLPRSLEGACAALRLATQKDDRGKRLVHKFAKPRRASKDNSDEYWDGDSAPDDWVDFLAYNVTDTAAMRGLHYALPPLSDREQRLWEITVRSNERGMVVDAESIPIAAAVVREETARLAARFEALTGAKPFSPAARAALGVDSLAKVEVRHALRRKDLAPHVREALEIRKRVAKASVKKLAALAQRTSLDGRLRGALIYSGAERTTRWSGGGVQLHNLPRGLAGKTDAAFDALEAVALDALYEDPILTVSEMLKGFLVGPFLIGDFAQVEARNTAWYARQDDLVAAFAAGVEIYCSMASDIYGHPVGKHDYDDALHINKRQLGKIAILGCGYGLGAKKLRKTLDEQFDVDVDLPFAERVVDAYRDKYPRIPKFWSLLSRGFAHVVRHGSHRVRVGPLFMGTTTLGGLKFAYVELPSGRQLYYAEPRLAESDPELPGCERGFIGEDSVSYLGRDLHRGGQWGRVSTYGGKLTENAVQAFSRDLLADAMLRLDDAGFPIVLTVHDEVTAEGEAPGLPEFTRIMNEVPPWAAGMPLKAETYACRRYRKD